MISIVLLDLYGHVLDAIPVVQDTADLRQEASVGCVPRPNEVGGERRLGLATVSHHFSSATSNRIHFPAAVWPGI